jgi:hypothetical protein
MSGSIFSWNGQNIDDFSRVPMQIGHHLHQSDLFGDDALARLIENTDRENYYVNTMDIDAHDVSTRREGETGDLSGKAALRAVADGHIWYLLMRPEKVDPRYGELVERIYDEIGHQIPGFRATMKKMSILVSSPKVQVYYHCDVPGQTLWQIRGSKRVYVYPNQEPYLHQPSLEKVVLNEAHEISIPYRPEFDEAAVIYDLQPGQMLHWPLNAPHRIINHDCVNVSFTTEHFTDEIRRQFIVNKANGILRHRLGLNPRSQSTGGLAYWAKYGVAGAYKASGLQKQRRLSFKVDFTVDPDAPRGVRTIDGYEFRK